MHIDAAVKDSFGIPIENAVEILVRVAVRACVLDKHPMVSQLMIFGQVKPIEYAFNSRSIQGRMYVVPRQQCSEGDGMRNEVCASSQVCVQGRDVKCGD